MAITGVDTLLYKAKSVEFVGETVDDGYGITITMKLPGDVEMQLYEPRHATAI